MLDFLYMIVSCSCCYEEDFIRHTQLENKFYEDYPIGKNGENNLNRRKNVKLDENTYNIV